MQQAVPGAPDLATSTNAQLTIHEQAQYTKWMFAEAGSLASGVEAQMFRSISSTWSNDRCESAE